MKKWKKIIKILLIAAGIMAALFSVVLLCFLPYIRRILKLRTEAYLYVRDSSAQTFQDSQSSVVYDALGNVLFTYSGEKDLHYVSIEQIPQTLIDSFVVMEDRSFYDHQGVDYKAVVRAMVANYEAEDIVQGASTITQQLARNIFLTQDVNYSRKIEEIFIAYALEEKYSKDDIMEFYLNNIYFGNGFYGVEAAAEGYFDKKVSQLTTGECILLAAVPNNPSRYDLFRHEEAAVQRAKLIVHQLFEAGYISELDYLIYSSGTGNSFVSQKLLEKLKNQEGREQTTAQGYVYTYVMDCAVKYLMNTNGFVFRNDFATEAEEEAYDEEYSYWYKLCQQRLFTGGYVIQTSINLSVQDKLQRIMDEKLAELDLEDGTLLQGGAVCIDNASGLVIAAVGGRTEETVGYGFNRAYQSYRQPGSAIKPLNVYAPYLCAGHSPQEIVDDTYDPLGPRNAGGAYAGKITLEEAVKYSKNTIPWKIYQEMTPSRCMNFLLKMGFKKIYMDKEVLAGALGGFSYGVSPEEMAGGFAALENDGVYRQTTCIRQISTSYGEILPGFDSVTVYTSDASRIMTEMLEKAVREGTGKRAALSSQPCAGKTGTTNSNKDAWFVGYTAYYTTSVWAGYDIPQEINLKNGNVSCDIWHDFMEYLHTDLAPREFPAPEEVPAPMKPEESEQTTEDEWALPTEEELTLPPEEELTLPPEEELTLPAEEELTLPAEEELTLPVEEELTLSPEEVILLS